MRSILVHTGLAGCLALGFGAGLLGQNDTAEAHRAIAREAAGQEHLPLFNTVCRDPNAARTAGARGGTAGAAATPQTAGATGRGAAQKPDSDTPPYISTCPSLRTAIA